MKKKQKPDLTLPEMLVVGFYVIFAIFWLYQLVEKLLEVAGLIKI